MRAAQFEKGRQRAAQNLRAAQGLCTVLGILQILSLNVLQLIIGILLLVAANGLKQSKRWAGYLANAIGVIIALVNLVLSLLIAISMFGGPAEPSVAMSWFRALFWFVGSVAMIVLVTLSWPVLLMREEALIGTEPEEIFLGSWATTESHLRSMLQTNNDLEWLRPLMTLIKELRDRGYDKRLRVRQSMFTLILSRCLTDDCGPKEFSVTLKIFRDGRMIIDCYPDSGRSIETPRAAWGAELEDRLEELAEEPISR